jgi:asparagine synthetase B (glutamine-hydrolysing)
MCGIAGIVGGDGLPHDAEERAIRMRDIISYR